VSGGEEGLRTSYRVVRESLSAVRMWSRDLNSAAEWVLGRGPFQIEGTTETQALRWEPSVTVWLEPRAVWDKNLPHGELSHAARQQRPSLDHSLLCFPNCEMCAQP